MDANTVKNTTVEYVVGPVIAYFAIVGAGVVLRKVRSRKAQKATA